MPLKRNSLPQTVDVRAAVELLKTNGNWVWMVESLPRLVELQSSAAVSLAVSSFPSLQPWKVIELFGGAEAAVRDYLTGLMGNEEVRTSEDLVRQWLTALLRDAPSADQLFISIDMPKRGALNVTWPQQGSLDELITKPNLYTYSAYVCLTSHYRCLFIIIIYSISM